MSFSKVLSASPKNTAPDSLYAKLLNLCMRSYKKECMFAIDIHEIGFYCYDFDVTELVTAQDVKVLINHGYLNASGYNKKRVYFNMATHFAILEREAYGRHGVDQPNHDDLVIRYVEYMSNSW